MPRLVLTAEVGVSVDGTTTPVRLEVVRTRFGDPGSFLEEAAAPAGRGDRAGLTGRVCPAAVAVVALAALLALVLPRRGRS